MNTESKPRNFNSHLELHQRIPERYIRIADEFGNFRAIAFDDDKPMIYDGKIDVRYKKDTHPFTGEKLDTE